MLGLVTQSLMPAIADIATRRLVLPVTSARDPDVIIGEVGDAYLLRWFLIPRNRFFNIYLHCFLRSDDDRALHDHPWPWMSFIIRGSYTEHTIAAGGVHKRRTYSAGALRFGLPWKAHRIEIEKIDPQKHDKLCWTIFITGPRIRQWGFHCPDGWVHWSKFTDPASGGNRTGRGCDQ